ncbi:11327_t:CDS:2 [Racocetra fulgida]|uniref:11327_t:CDS:1 n=1 Tax=Racocetra fulgida TaxID=60492 RepID=A0A9N8VDS9_9GLOM|nr:11327_t:CDS:2 [Racocetra fulgida]
MLQELLEQAYGKKNVKLNQLKKQDKKRNELDLRKKMRKYNRLIDKFNRKNDEDKRQDILDQID